MIERISGAMFGETFDLVETRSTPKVDLPPEIEKLRKEHDQALEGEMKRLQANFCVNQWKVKR
jgi:hypothetical protein